MPRKCRRDGHSQGKCTARPRGRTIARGGGADSTLDVPRVLGARILLPVHRGPDKARGGTRTVGREARRWVHVRRRQPALLPRIAGTQGCILAVCQVPAREQVLRIEDGYLLFLHRARAGLAGAGWRARVHHHGILEHACQDAQVAGPDHGRFSAGKIDQVS